MWQFYIEIMQLWKWICFLKSASFLKNGDAQKKIINFFTASWAIPEGDFLTDYGESRNHKEPLGQTPNPFFII